MKPLSLQKVNEISPYQVMMVVEPNTYRFANAQEQYVIMVANIHDLEGVDNYAAMILRKDNPHFVEYVAEFNNTVNMFMVKPTN